MKIIPISVPTPFYVGDVNVYLVKDDPLTLIDAGPKTDEAAKILREKLKRHGVELSDIRRIVLTHAHEDHCGLAKRIRDESNDAEILIHEWETGHLFGQSGRRENLDFMSRAGVPSTIIQEMAETYSEISLLTDSLEESDYQNLNDGMELEFSGGSLEVLHTPGHTPGSCSFVRAADRTLIVGDCVLKRITPNPIVSPDPIDRTRRFRSLGEYLVSLARIRSHSPTMVYGGHGEPITDFEEIFNRYVRAIDERQNTAIALVERAGSTAFDVAQRLFPNAIGKEVHQFLAISEAIAHLDHAESRGRVGVEMMNGVEIYKR